MSLEGFNLFNKYYFNVLCGYFFHFVFVKFYFLFYFGGYEQNFNFDDGGTPLHIILDWFNETSKKLAN